MGRGGVDAPGAGLRWGLMKQTLRLGRIAGIRVGVHWSVLVIAALLVQGLALTVLPQAATGRSPLVYWLLAVAGTVLFLVSLLAHELAHAFVARRFGIRVDQITLWLLGGVAEFRGEPPTARADLLTAGAGPLTSAAAGVAFGAAAHVGTNSGAPETVVVLLGWLAGINLLLAVFNLLPGAPLDGGRMLRALLWRWRRDRTWAALIAARAGTGLGVVLLFAGCTAMFVGGWLDGLWLALVGWFLLSASGAEAAAVRTRAALGRKPVSAAMHTDLVYGDPQEPVAGFLGAATAAPHRLFPLRTREGRPAGIVRLADLTAVPEQARAATTLACVGTPVSAVPVVEADRLLADVVPLVSGGQAALVTDHGTLVGVLTSEDIARATELST